MLDVTNSSASTYRKDKAIEEGDMNYVEKTGTQ